MPRLGLSPFPLIGEPRPVPELPVIRPTPVPVSNAPGARRYRHPEVLLYVETGRGTDEFEPMAHLDWTTITVGQDGGDTTAALATGLDAAELSGGGSIGNEHFAHILTRLHPDYRVRIVQRLGFNPTVWFQGYPIAPTINWDARRQTVTCLCLCEGQEILRTAYDAQIIGRFMRFDPMSTWDPEYSVGQEVQESPPVFNAGNRPNRSASAYPITDDNVTHRIHLFTEDDAPDAKHWSFAEALRYLAYHHVLAGHLAVNVSDLLDDTAGLVGAEPAPNARDPFIRRMCDRPNDLSVGSMSVEEAIALLCDAAGLHYEIGLRNVGTLAEISVEHYLRVYAVLEKPEQANDVPERLMIVPVVRDIPREAPFSDLTGRTDREIALANKAPQAGLTIDRRAINAPVIVGGAREYECNVLMRPGWFPLNDVLDNLVSPYDREEAIGYWEGQFTAEFEDDETRMPTSIYHGSHPDHHLVRDVGRLWVFPDDHRYLGDDGLSSPYARTGWPWTLYDPIDPDDADRTALVLTRADIGGGIADSRLWVPRRRPLRETIGRLLAAGDRAPIVWFNFDCPADKTQALGDPNWVRYSGQVEIDPYRAAIYVLEDNLLAAAPLLAGSHASSTRMLEAYIWGHFAVAVTCVIRGDTRLVNRPATTGASFERPRYRVADTGLERFAYRNRRGQNSRLDEHETDPDPEYEDRDDTEKLDQFAMRTAERTVGDAIAGSFEVFWLDPTYRLGDSMAGVEGLGIEFNRLPEIVRIEYRKDATASYRTVCHLTDLRDAAEVGAE